MEAWILEKVIDFDDFAKRIDPELFTEASEFRSRLEYSAEKTLADLGLKVGGAGHIELIYFVVKRLGPKTVLETGVSVGFSSNTILSALSGVEGGELYSSDLPYFRLPDPERLVGCLVAQPRPSNWHLYTSGDESNLLQITKSLLTKIDLIHYDSDKTYQGKKWCFEVLQPYVSAEAIWIFDDIQDDNFFYDLVRSRELNYQIFLYGGKYVGLIGNLA